MFTLVAYSETFSASATLDQVTPCADQHVRVEGNNIIVPAGMNNLLGAYAIGSYATRAQIETPALRRTLLYELAQIDAASEPTSNPPFTQLFDAPLPLDEFEPMRALLSVSGAGQGTVLVWLGDGAQAPVSGDIYTVMATASATLDAYAWTNAALSLSQTLPAGTYQCVGMRAQSAGLIAARLVFVGQAWRPGCIGFDSIADRELDIFRRGKLGIWGEFRHDQPPTVDFLSSSADTSETVWLDLIKVA